VPVRELSLGDRIELGQTTFEVLHPEADSQGDSANDASLVLRLRFGEVSFLFPGDIEEAGEALLLADSAPAATVLKAPHHGSRTSSTPEFVAAVHPRHVVFPVGHNRFGFPHQEVVERYRAAGATTWRTDESGAITFKSDGHVVEAEPWLR
jgi:competence protein ComEC